MQAKVRRSSKRSLRRSFFAFLLMLSAGCSATAGTNSSATSYSAEVGSEFDVRLPENRSTGFSWALAEPLDREILRFVDQQYVAAETDLVGVGGTSVWRFRGVAAGQTTLSFVYRRAWEKGVEPARRVDYSVVIK